MKRNSKIKSSVVSPCPEGNPPGWVSFWKGRTNIIFLLGILLITFIVYLPCLQNDFVNLDDPAYINRVKNIENWGDFFENLKRFFTTRVVSGYTPLVVCSFAVEKILYGLDRPGLWHLDNIILHLVCVLLVFRISLALGLKIIPAAFCALLFGIHPMRVESVAWITERKDLLYGVFYFLALYYYIKSVKLSFHKRFLLIILTSFTLSLLSKIQAVTLPLSMLLVDYYLGRELNLKLVYEKLHYFLLSFVIGLLGIYFLWQPGTLETNKLFSLFQRIFIGSYSYVVYLVKSIFPYKMVPIYIYPSSIGVIFYVSILPALFVSGASLYFFLKKKRLIAFSILFFTLNIIFLLQVLAQGQSFLADRFTYIPYWGLFFLYASGIQWILEKYKNFNKQINVVLFLFLILLGYRNYEQNKIWKNDETLWTHQIKNYINYAPAWQSRGSYYFQKGDLKKALHDYNKAILLNQNDPWLYNKRGLIYSETNGYENLNKAIHDFTSAFIMSAKTNQRAEYKDDFLLNRGQAYVKMKRFDDALQDFNSAEKLNPANKEIYSNRAQIYVKLKQYLKAQSDLEKYVSLEPGNSYMWSNLGETRRLNKQYSKSLSAFNKAIELDPDNLNYFSLRVKTYYEMGDIHRARENLIFLLTKGFSPMNKNYEKILETVK